MRGLWKPRALWMVLAATCLVPPCFGQSSTASEEAKIRLRAVTEPAICGKSMPEKGVKAALRLVCLRDTLGIRNMAVEKAIIIGFVGGFVRSDDMRHPEVQFAAHLREACPSEVHTEVFANHDGKHALRRVLELLSKDGDGVLTSREKERARIIIYGHSWGASQAVTLADDLGRLDIPVSLTILVDSVHKPGNEDAVIPSNVKSAVNFYQTKGIIHGRSHIRAADPERTNIIGNFQMTYQDRRINCDNYPWIARHLNKPHHEIENDPLVWEQIASMIDSELFKGTSMVEASLPSAPLVVKQDQR
jgi:pimeloyl-ACP methyl ester carboxylesterase